MIYTRFAGAILFSILATLARAQTITPDSSNALDSHMGQKAITRVTGIGGIFLKAKDPAMLRAWYKTHLGIDVQAWGGTAFRWVDSSGHPVAGKTAWFVGDGKNFAPSTASFMVNYRVPDLHGLMITLRAEGCDVLEKTEESEFGKFGWVMDPEGNKVELWQPPDGQ
ncbi:VOC family protein [Collimonas sp. H4R21]|jgi:predicted enzyme related to lactoylglutathione lyase|uniref:VOC family protein n=1 Tax=Collimonas rhizosphaerae TaxID=3126357 RepID=A0ABU9Q0W0_9BURK